MILAELKWSELGWNSRIIIRLRMIKSSHTKTPFALGNRTCFGIINNVTCRIGLGKPPSKLE